MTATQISADVERGLELRETIKSAQAELKTIEKRLEAAGLEGEQVPLQDADREGRQFLARSPKLGLIVPVIFESDQIVASFAPHTDIHASLTAIANGHLPEFFRETRKYERIQKDGQNFRKAACQILAERAPAFISAALQRDKSGIPKSRTLIAWDNAKTI